MANLPNETGLPFPKLTLLYPYTKPENKQTCMETMQFLVNLGNQAYGVVLFWLDCFTCNQTFEFPINQVHV